MELLGWLQWWLARQCDGEWEHGEGVRIRSLDNPGWSVIVDVNGTEVSIEDEPWKIVETSETDWFGFKVQDNVFDGAGDPTKLGLLLRLFRERVETNSTAYTI